MRFFRAVISLTGLVIFGLLVTPFICIFVWIIAQHASEFGREIASRNFGEAVADLIIIAFPSAVLALLIWMLIRIGRFLLQQRYESRCQRLTPVPPVRLRPKGRPRPLPRMR